MPAGVSKADVEAKATALAALSQEGRRAYSAQYAKPVHDKRYQRPGTTMSAFRVDAVADLPPGTVLTIMEGVLKTNSEVNAEQKLHYKPNPLRNGMPRTLDYLLDIIPKYLTVDAGPLGGAGAEQGVSGVPKRGYLGGLFNDSRDAAPNVMVVHAVGFGACGARMLHVEGDDGASGSAAHPLDDLLLPMALLITTRHIKASEQLMWDYGDPYWQGHEDLWRKAANIKQEDQRMRGAARAGGADEPQSSADGGAGDGQAGDGQVSDEDDAGDGCAGPASGSEHGAERSAAQRTKGLLLVTRPPCTTDARVLEGITALKADGCVEASAEDVLEGRAIKLGGNSERARKLLTADLDLLVEQQAMIYLRRHPPFVYNAQTRAGTYFGDILKALQLHKSQGVRNNTSGSSKLKVVWTRFTGQPEGAAPTAFYYRLWLSERDQCIAGGASPPYSAALYDDARAALQREDEAAKVKCTKAREADAAPLPPGRKRRAHRRPKRFRDSAPSDWAAALDGGGSNGGGDDDSKSDNDSDGADSQDDDHAGGAAGGVDDDDDDDDDDATIVIDINCSHCGVAIAGARCNCATQHDGRSPARRACSP